MVGSAQVGEAISAFRKKWISWLLVGLLPGILFASLLYVTSPIYEPGRPFGAAIVVTSLVSNVLGVICSALYLSLGLSQFRTGTFGLDTIRGSVRSIPSLVLLGLASGIASASYWQISKALNLDPMFAGSLLYSLLCVPFALAVLFVVDKGMSPISATWQSIRTTIPTFVGVCVALFLAILLMTAMAFPFMCLASGISSGGGPGSVRGGDPPVWPGIVMGVAMWLIGYPVYYLTIAAIYRALVPDQQWDNPGKPPILMNPENPPTQIPDQ